MIWILLQLGAAAALLACFRLRTRDRPELSRALVWSLPVGAAGAYALGFLYRLPGFVRGEVDPFGAAAWGALFGIALAFAWQLRRRGRPVAASLDALAPCLAVCLAIGRLGCFAAGCDAGRVTDLAWAVRFEPGSATFHDHVARGLVLAGDRSSLAVHPAQLYEAAAALAIALAIWASRAERRFAPGTTLALAAIGYACARSLIELCRETPLASPALWTSLAVLIVCAHWLMRQSRRGPLWATAMVALGCKPMMHDAGMEGCVGDHTLGDVEVSTRARPRFDLHPRVRVLVSSGRSGNGTVLDDEQRASLEDAVTEQLEKGAHLRAPRPGTTPNRAAASSRSRSR